MYILLLLQLMKNVMPTLFFVPYGLAMQNQSFLFFVFSVFLLLMLLNLEIKMFDFCHSPWLLCLKWCLIVFTLKEQCQVYKLYIFMDFVLRQPFFICFSLTSVITLGFSNLATIRLRGIVSDLSGCEKGQIFHCLLVALMERILVFSTVQ